VEKNKEIRVLPLIYDLLLWYAPKLGQYPKSYKFTLGQRVTDGMLNILEAVIEAKYAAKKKAHFLRRANLELEKLRFLIRLSKDLQCINLKTYEFASVKINEIGKMVGGWEKYAKSSGNAREDGKSPLPSASPLDKRGKSEAKGG